MQAPLVVLLLLLGAMLSPAGAQPSLTDPPRPAATLEVIDLRHRSAEELIPLLQPLLEGRGVVSGQGNTLVLRVPAAELPSLRAAVERLDTPPLRLLVSVRRQARPTGGGLYSRRDRITEQSVQVLDGHQAFIGLGEERSRASGSIVVTPDGSEGLGGIDWTVLESGFYVRPRVVGDRVSLAVTPHERYLDAAGVVQGVVLTTTVAGRLGEWLTLGESGPMTGPGVSTRRLREPARLILLKVEALP